MLQLKAHLLLLNSSFGPCLPKQRYGIAFSLQRKQITLTNATPTTASTAVTIICDSWPGTPTHSLRSTIDCQRQRRCPSRQNSRGEI